MACKIRSAAALGAADGRLSEGQPVSTGTARLEYKLHCTTLTQCDAGAVPSAVQVQPLLVQTCLTTLRTLHRAWHLEHLPFFGKSECNRRAVAHRNSSPLTRCFRAVCCTVCRSQFCSMWSLSASETRLSRAVSVRGHESRSRQRWLMAAQRSCSNSFSKPRSRLAAPARGRTDASTASK